MSGNPIVVLTALGVEYDVVRETDPRVHRSVGARIEHAFAHLKVWKALRDYRCKARTLRATVAGIAYLHNLAKSRPDQSDA